MNKSRFHRQHSLLVLSLNIFVNVDTNDGLSLLGQVIERVHGIRTPKKWLMAGQNWTFEQIIQNNILIPLNMSRSCYSVPSALKSDVVVPNNSISALSVDLDLLSLMRMFKVNETNVY